MNTNLFGIFIKYPEPGKVKTRLAKDIGKEKAAHIYRRIVELIMANTIPAHGAYDRIVFYDPAERHEDFTSWLPGERFLLQQGNDVGQRMDSAIRSLLGMGAEKAVLTGADIPALSQGIIDAAFQELDRSDIVIGPARDGGYYLIGMKSPYPDLFQDVRWSTGKVLEDTLMKLQKLRLRFTLVERLSDLDTREDLQHVPDVLPNV